MALQDLRGLLDQDLELPIGGNVYAVPPPTARVGLRLQLLRDLDSIDRAGVELKPDDRRLLQVADEDEPQFYRDCLGSAYDTMLANDVTLLELRVAAGAAFMCWTAANGQGRAEAEAFWRSQLDPQMAATRQETPTPAGRASASMAAASTTKPRNSGSGTSSPKGSKPKTGKRALRSAS